MVACSTLMVLSPSPVFSSDTPTAPPLPASASGLNRSGLLHHPGPYPGDPRLQRLGRARQHRSIRTSAPAGPSDTRQGSRLPRVGLTPIPLAGLPAFAPGHQPGHDAVGQSARPQLPSPGPAARRRAAAGVPRQSAVAAPTQALVQSK